MQFVKVEGAGNDYVLVDGFAGLPPDPAALSRAVSDRHRGIGSDGLIVVSAADEPGVHGRMGIWNADGSEALMCGNGLRCVVRWLAEQGHAPGDEVRVATLSGPRVGRLRPDGSVETSMGVPSFDPAELPADLPGDPPEHPLPEGLRADPDVAFGVSVGNPHLVVRVPDPDAVDLARHGEALNTSPRMQAGANVHVVGPPRGATVVARTWERGSGATRACGTGAVAVAAVARRLGWVDDAEVTVRMPGGELRVRFDPTGLAWLAGPANLVFRGEWPGS